MIPGLGSLRGRLIALSVVVFLGLCATALVLTGKVQDSLERSRQTASRLDEITHSLALIQRTLFDAEGEPSRHAALAESGQYPPTQSGHVQALEEVERLHALTLQWGDAELIHQVELLRSHVAALGANIRQQSEFAKTGAEVMSHAVRGASEGVTPEDRGVGHGSSDSLPFPERLITVFADIRNAAMRIEQRLHLLADATAEESMALHHTVIRSVWLIAGLAVTFILLASIFHELFVRRPMAQLTHALRALERGASYSPLIRAHSREMDAMLEAFHDMQRQVYAREMRLAAILDNAGEGIITINQAGRIETFNNAAEQLFQFRAEDVLGRNVSMLMPQPTCDEHDAYLERYLASKEGRVIGSEMNVTAKRKDGTLFPMSIKITETVLEGRHYFTAIVSDISEHKAMLDHLRQLAEHDSLTGLYNRQYFLDELERVVERAQRSAGLDCALLYIDLDNFKYVNDTLGHLAGDKLLMEVAGILQKRSRRGDILVRLGGDEFAVLLFDVNDETARTVAESYRQVMVEYTFREEGRVIDIGCSIGVAMLSADVRRKEDLMVRADLSCHMAKRAGRNCVHVYRADDGQNLADMSADMGWARTIKECIEANRFDFALQPIVSVDTGEVVTQEVLLRMKDAEGSVIMPSGFMPAAERFGLIIDVDRWVVEHAIALLAQRGGQEHFAINLSGTTMGDPAFLAHLKNALERYGVFPDHLTFEITETVAIRDLAAASRLLEQLRELGCSTALDDFGSGYSSFAYLRDLPVDYVKIDGSYVRNIDQDTLHLAVVRSMNEIAHAMGKRTVAEFVGNARVLEILCELGVDYAQGFHTGKPILAGFRGMAVSATAAPG